MPRLSPSLIRQARLNEPHVAKLLPVCRDPVSARNEVRWMKEHASQQARRNGTVEKRILSDLVSRRAGGEPLQYILGTEFFGDLEIKCRPGVLIPRPETAASVSHLVSLLVGQKLPERLRVLDLCTGTGCIPLLFHHDFYEETRQFQTALDLIGVDVSSKALRLASDNLRTQRERRLSNQAQDEAGQALNRMQFLEADVLAKSSIFGGNMQQSPAMWTECDILISNPPYISSKAFRTTTARSVRHFEPKLALVPFSTPAASELDGDVFYPRLLEIADEMRAKVVLFEVADLEQAVRVARMAVETSAWQHVELWRDWPGEGSQEPATVAERNIKFRGTGHGRSVFAFRGEARDWLPSV